MKFTVVMPSFNQALFLDRAINSVVSQKGIGVEFELELIIMDGGSSDDSVKIIKKYAEEYEFIKWSSKKDKGQSDALSKGFGKATGDIFAWLNSDDEYLPGALLSVSRVFKKRGVLWLSGYSRIVDRDNVEILRGVSFYKKVLSYLPSFVLFTENFISQPSTFFKKEIYDDVGALNKSLFFCMDYDLWLRFLKKSRPLFIRKDLSFFRRYPDSKSGSGFKKQFKEQFCVAKKYTNNKLLLAIHKFQNWKTVLLYKLF